MVKLGTKSMVEFRFPDPYNATPGIAESGKNPCEPEVKRKGYRRERPVPKWRQVWEEIVAHPYIGWRQLNKEFPKHTLSVSLRFLIEKGAVKKIEQADYSGRGRKPTCYLALCKSPCKNKTCPKALNPAIEFPLCMPFIGVPAKTVTTKDGGKRHFFGKWVTRKSNREARAFVMKKEANSNNKSKPQYEEATKTFTPTRFVRLSPEEKKAFDTRRENDPAFAEAVRLATRKKRKMDKIIRRKKRPITM